MTAICTVPETPYFYLVCLGDASGAPLARKSFGLPCINETYRLNQAQVLPLSQQMETGASDTSS